MVNSGDVWFILGSFWVMLSAFSDIWGHLERSWPRWGSESDFVKIWVPFWMNFGFHFGPEIYIFGHLFLIEFLDTSFDGFWEDFGGHLAGFGDAKTIAKQKWRKCEKPMFHHVSP